jgi:hypothetical protein
VQGKTPSQLASGGWCAVVRSNAEKVFVIHPPKP